MHTGFTRGLQATGTAASFSDGTPQARDAKSDTPHLKGHPYVGDAQRGLRIIRADHVELALLARKASPAARWAAMSNGAVTPPCRPRSLSESLMTRLPPAVVPMDRGALRTTVERVRQQHGRAEVQAMFGAGIRAMRAELTDSLLRPLRNLAAAA